jgi:hypothetical protein
MGEGQAPPFIHPYIHPSPTHTRAISASWTEHDRVGNLLDGDPSAMLMSRPDAAALLEVLDFHPPDWRQYYRELFDRFPNLAGRWINVNLWNMPERYPVDQWSIDDDARMREAAPGSPTCRFPDAFRDKSVGAGSHVPERDRPPASAAQARPSSGRVWFTSPVPGRQPASGE